MLKSKNGDIGFFDEQALRYHAKAPAGKVALQPTKPMETQHDLSLAYTPGVAAPVLAIAQDANKSYDYTAKGNAVAVVSDGSAILGLGNLGPSAAKPVMEGKAVLFKRFADIDAIDLEIKADSIEKFVEAVAAIEPSVGGINLEDICAPQCFIIEKQLRERMNIPVFHDDQHGTAIIAAAGLLNALDITGRKIGNMRIVVNGAGAAGIACLNLFTAMGAAPDNIILCDSKGPVHQGREDISNNQWKVAAACSKKVTTLAAAVRNSHVFVGLSVKGALSPEMVKSMARRPIIFAMANPDPEITPEQVALVRSDAIIATGRSDYPNQVNNVLGFPYIFRGALDVRARAINEPMKVACAKALAKLAREDVPDEVAAAYKGTRLRYGPDYIIPAPFDPRLIREIPPAVAEAAIKSGVAGVAEIDSQAYRDRLSARRNPVAGFLQTVVSKLRQEPKRIIFAEGEEEPVVRAAIAVRDMGVGTPILVGRKQRVYEAIRNAGIEMTSGFEICDSDEDPHRKDYATLLYERLQRQGFLLRDCERMVSRDRNVFSACMLSSGRADALVTGITRNYAMALQDVQQVIDPVEGKKVIGISLLFAAGRPVFVADTIVHDMPTAEELADIAQQAAEVARGFGYEPCVAMLAGSTFGYPRRERTSFIEEAVRLLDKRKVDFSYDGEMTADVALNPKAMERFSFCRLSGPANVLIMPAIHSASIATTLLEELGGATVIGPMLVGLRNSVQIARLGSRVSDIVNMAVLAAYDIDGKKKNAK